ncbi:hypothetical protein BJ963_003068 [Leifsonia soli]|uniref:Uncharacterized protein n=1 Tax=Leifsonia soli TaxID=582665 RepID=A0A852T250_9MICO|nr:hypothetical protein [Leifsonia soli]
MAAVSRGVHGAPATGIGLAGTTATPAVVRRGAATAIVPATTAQPAARVPAATDTGPPGTTETVVAGLVRAAAPRATARCRAVGVGAATGRMVPAAMSAARAGIAPIAAGRRSTVATAPRAEEPTAIAAARVTMGVQLVSGSRVLTMAVPLVSGSRVAAMTDRRVAASRVLTTGVRLVSGSRVLTMAVPLVSGSRVLTMAVPLVSGSRVAAMTDRRVAASRAPRAATGIARAVTADSTTVAPRGRATARVPAVSATTGRAVPRRTTDSGRAKVDQRAETGTLAMRAGAPTKRPSSPASCSPSVRATTTR